VLRGLPPGAYPGKAWELAAQALKKTHWSLLDSQKSGRIHPVIRPGIPDRLLQEVSVHIDADAVLFCSEMAERPLTWRLCRGPFAKLRPVGASTQSCNRADKTSRFELA
jgi:hypothetical protein